VDFFNAAECGKRGHRHCSPSVAVQKWKKPPYGVVKLNWDAAINVEVQMMGLGIVARDHTGQVLAAFLL
jgi:hypothetical protein